MKKIKETEKTKKKIKKLINKDVIRKHDKLFRDNKNFDLLINFDEEKINVKGYIIGIELDKLITELSVLLTDKHKINKWSVMINKNG